MRFLCSGSLGGFSDSLRRAGRVRDVPEPGRGVRESGPNRSAVFRCTEGAL